MVSDSNWNMQIYNPRKHLQGMTYTVVIQYRGLRLELMTINIIFSVVNVMMLTQMTLGTMAMAYNW